jgi:hypothetical protein
MNANHVGHDVGEFRNGRFDVGIRHGLHGWQLFGSASTDF